jgi:RNA polymerase sigma factor (sigma-70 family)
MAAPLELEALVAWAKGAALAWARVKQLPEHELVSAALRAVCGAVRTHGAPRVEGAKIAPLGAHVRLRVRYELLDAAKGEVKRHDREPLLDDLAPALPPDVEDDALALARLAGVEDLIAGSPEEILLAREVRAVRDRAVARLSPDDRRLYDLRFRRGLGWEEVATKLGIKSRAAQYRAEEIRAKLTEALRAYRDDE